MIDDDLIAKFDRIKDLPISEEMLGAYMESKLDEIDSNYVVNTVNNDLFLINLSHDVCFEAEGIAQITFAPDVFFHDEVIDLDSADIFTNVEEKIENEICITEDNNELNDTDFCLPDIDSFLSDGDIFESDSFE